MCPEGALSGLDFEWPSQDEVAHRKRPSLARVSSVRYSVRPVFRVGGGDQDQEEDDEDDDDDNDDCWSVFSGASHRATHFANVEDMLFEVFRCEETDSIDSIAIGHFLKVGSIISIPLYVYY